MTDHSSQAEVEQEPSSDLRPETPAQSNELVQHFGIHIEMNCIPDHFQAAHPEHQNAQCHEEEPEALKVFLIGLPKQRINQIDADQSFHKPEDPGVVSGPVPGFKHIDTELFQSQSLARDNSCQNNQNGSPDKKQQNHGQGLPNVCFQIKASLFQHQEAIDCHKIGNRLHNDAQRKLDFAENASFHSVHIKMQQRHMEGNHHQDCDAFQQIDAVVAFFCHGLFLEFSYFFTVFPANIAQGR